MGKKNKKKKCGSMREWPSDDACGVFCDELLIPLKKVMHEGYKIERRPITQFTYNGYNIGKEDRILYPTPEERFSSRWLENETKFNRTLLDNILFTAFQLGMEQGRREERQGKLSYDILQGLILSRTNKIKELRRKLADYDDTYLDDVAGLATDSENESLLIDSLNIEEPVNVDP